MTELTQEQADAIHRAYMESQRTGVPIPISQDRSIDQNTVRIPVLSSDIQNTSKQTLWNESQEYAQFFGLSAESIMNRRLESVGPSQRYLDILGQYNQQHYATVGSGGTTYNPQYGVTPTSYPNTAAGIAAEVARTGGTLNPYLAEKALSEGYTGPLTIPTYNGQIDLGRSTVPIRDLSSGPMPSFGSGLGGTVTSFVPYGDFTQERLENTKLTMDFKTGELGIYQQPYGHSIFNLVSGGSRAALQSGMFTINSPETPFVVDQSGVGKFTLPSGFGLSRLGAEAYGGFVSPLDNRTIQSTGAKLSTYSNLNNLANYVDPFGVNLGKGEAPGAKIPWNMGKGSPAIQYMNDKGLTGISPNIPGISPGKTVFTTTQSAAYIPEARGLPAPFRSTVSTGSPDMFKVQSPIGGLIGLELFGKKKDEIIGGTLGSGSDFVTGLIGWTPFRDRMQTVDPALSSWRKENEKMKSTASPEEYNKFLQTSFEKGILSKPVTSATFIENPALTHDYGAFSEWGAGAGNFVKKSLGITDAQLDAYQYKVETQGNLAEQFIFGTGHTLSTHPERFISGAIGGGLLVGSGELLGGMYAGTGLAARAGAFAIRHPTTAAVFSGMARYGVPAFLGGATYYGASEGFTASPARTTVNLGKMFPELVGVTHGGLGAWGFTRGIDRGYFGFGTKQTIKPEVPTLDLRPEIDLTKMIPEINLDTMRVSEYVRPSNVATRAEQAMIMRQFQLTPQEIAFAKKTGASLNDILQVRELTMEKPGIETIEMPDIMSIQVPMMEQATRTKTISLFGTKPMSGSNLIKNLYSSSGRMSEPFSSLDTEYPMKIGSKGVIDSASSTLPVMTREGVRIQVPFLGQMTWQRTVPVSSSIRTPSQVPDITHKVRNEPFAPTIPDISKKVPGMTFETPRKTVPERPFAPPITIPKKPVPERPFVPGRTTPDTRVPRQPVPEGPIPPPFMIPGWPFGGGGSSGQYGRMGITRWKRENPVPTLPYLAAGMSVFGRGKKRGKGKRSLGNPFGGGPF